MGKCLGHDVSPWPVATWTPEMLTLVALYYHTDMDLARAKWGIARAATETASEVPNPTVAVAPGFNATTSDPTALIVNATVDFPIETANKRGYRIAQAKHNTESARAGILSAAWQVHGRVQRAALDHIGSNQALELLKQQQAAREQVVKLMELQQPQGNIPPTDVTQARIALRSTRLAVIDAQRQRMEAKVQLADALGLPASAVDGIRIDLTLTDDLPAPIGSADARRRALTARADVLSALADYAASQAALQLEIAKQYPDIHLTPGYEYDQGDNKWSLGLSITLPVFNQNRGAIREAEAKRAEAAAKFAALQAKIISDVERAAAAYEAAKLRLAVVKELRADVQKQRKAAEAGFAAGEISRLELAAVQLELQTTEQASQETVIKAHQAKLAIEEALQQPLKVPESLLLPSPKSPSTTRYTK